MASAYFNTKTLQHYSVMALRRYGIFFVLLLGFGFRIWGLWSAEIFHDEGLYAFRSIGYIDYIQNDDQTTPMQWFKNSPTLPWWTKLSFHDHPPLYFLVQHLFFKVFGNSLFVARLPSLIAGMFAIWLVYLIGRQLTRKFSQVGKTSEELFLQNQMWTLSGFLGQASREYLDTESLSEPANEDLEMARRRGDEKRVSLRAGKDAKETNILGEVFFGLLAALLLSVNHIHIWISRTSIMESLLITLMLANIYFFLRMLGGEKSFGSRAVVGAREKEAGNSKEDEDDEKKTILGAGKDARETNDLSWLWLGLTLGLVLLTKYTGIVLLPIYGMYCLLFHRRIFKDWRLYAALGVALVLFSPVIVYNFYLYLASGHFDLQIAYALGQKTPEWRASLGKIQDPFSVFIPNMLAMYSKPFLLAIIAGILSTLFFWRKESKEQKKSYVFLFSGAIFVTLLLIKIGVAYRFLTLYLSFVVFMVASAFIIIWRLIPQKIVFFVLLAGFVFWEIWFSFSGIFLEFPRLGVVELDQYLLEEIGRVRSSALIKSPNSHLDAVIQRYYNKLPNGDVPILIVYDENIVISPKLWLFARRLYYDGIPTMTVSQFNNLIAKSGVEYFKSYKMYFIKANENSVMINTNLFYSPDAKNLENFLKTEFSLGPIKTIYGFQPSNQGFQQTSMFYVYKILF